MGGQAEGFEYEAQGDEVVITHFGRLATRLRGAAAQRFLADIDDGPDGDPQGVMARVTGNYKRGNERQAKQHPRNRGRQ